MAFINNFTEVWDNIQPKIVYSTQIPSSTEEGVLHTVSKIDNEYTCTCRGFHYTRHCKHIEQAKTDKTLIWRKHFKWRDEYFSESWWQSFLEFGWQESWGKFPDAPEKVESGMVRDQSKIAMQTIDFDLGFGVHDELINKKCIIHPKYVNFDPADFKTNEIGYILGYIRHTEPSQYEKNVVVHTIYFEASSKSNRSTNSATRKFLGMADGWTQVVIKELVALNHFAIEGDPSFAFSVDNLVPATYYKWHGEKTTNPDNSGWDTQKLTATTTVPTTTVPTTATMPGTTPLDIDNPKTLNKIFTSLKAIASSSGKTYGDEEDCDEEDCDQDCDEEDCDEEDCDEEEWIEEWFEEEWDEERGQWRPCEDEDDEDDEEDDEEEEEDEEEEFTFTRNDLIKFITTPGKDGKSLFEKALTAYSGQTACANMMFEFLQDSVSE